MESQSITEKFGDNVVTITHNAHSTHNMDGTDDTHSTDSVEHVKAVLNSDMWKRWKAKLSSGTKKLSIKSLKFESINMFGKRPGFAKFETKTEYEGHEIPGIVFMRSNTCCIYPLFKVEDKYYTALVLQPRVPAGSAQFAECPAGIIEDGESAQCTIHHEAREELGLTTEDMETAKFVNMGKAIWGTEEPLYLSPGGSTEAMHFYVMYMERTQKWLDDLNGRRAGENQHERITVRVIPLENNFILGEVRNGLCDVKTLFGLQLLTHFLKSLCRVYFSDKQKNK